ncbi:glycosyltransferase, partial [bacterium]|nr:glycosyltransferase [bacterium]
MSKRRQIVELVVPCYNEADNLQHLFSEFEKLLLIDRSMDYRMLLVDNSSSDATWSIALTYARRNNKLRLIRLTRNFGKEASLSAGLNQSKGDAVIPIDADLQDPITVIPDLVTKWIESRVDVVLAIRNSGKSRSRFREFLSKSYLWLFSTLADMPIERSSGEFRLLSRKFVDAFNALPESERFVRGLFSWMGFETEKIYFDRSFRNSGKSRFSLGRLLRLGMDGLTSFSIKPLRIATLLGIFISGIAMSYAIFILIKTLIHDNPAPGYSSLMIALLFLSGVQLLSIGLVGEYVGRTLLEAKNRP